MNETTLLMRHLQTTVNVDLYETFVQKCRKKNLKISEALRTAINLFLRDD